MTTHMKSPNAITILSAYAKTPSVAPLTPVQQAVELAKLLVTAHDDFRHEWLRHRCVICGVPSTDMKNTDFYTACEEHKAVRTCFDARTWAEQNGLTMAEAPGFWDGLDGEGAANDGATTH